MPDVHVTMTGLELAFEEELEGVRGWHSDAAAAPAEFEPSRPTRKPTKKETAQEQTMVLGM